MTVDESVTEQRGVFRPRSNTTDDFETNATTLSTLRANLSDSTESLLSPDTAKQRLLLKEIDQSPKALAGFASGSVNLLKTVLGAAMLTLPYALSKIGIIPGLIFLLLAAVCSAFGLHLLSICANIVGRSSSMAAIAAVTYPRLGWLFDGAVVLKCIGVSISYLIVIGDGIQVLMVGWGVAKDSIGANPRLWISVSLIIVGALSILKKIDKLKYSSFLGLFGVGYLVILSIVLLADRRPLDDKPVLFAPFSFEGLQLFSTFVFAFTCHQNIFPIQNEMKNNSVPKMNQIIIFTTIVAMICYGLFALLTYLTFGNNVSDNIFNTYSPIDPAITVARILYIFLLICSYPLQAFPCRQSLESLIPLSKESKIVLKDRIYWFNTVFILLFTYAIAMAGLELKIMLSIVGATASTIICYILPFMFYYKLTEIKGWHPKRILALFLAVFGIISMILSLVGLAVTLYEKNNFDKAKEPTKRV